MVTLFNGISIFVGYLMPNLFLLKNTGVIFNPELVGWNKGFLAFPESISSKVDVMVLLEVELTYYDVGVLHFSLYAKGTLPCTLLYGFKYSYWILITIWFQWLVDWFLMVCQPSLCLGNQYHHDYQYRFPWLSLHLSRSSITPYRSSRQHPVSAQSCCR